MQYRVTKELTGRQDTFKPGDVLSSDHPNLRKGTDIVGLVRNGTLVPWDGDMIAPLDDSDTAGMKARIEALEHENKMLKAGTPKGLPVDAAAYEDTIKNLRAKAEEAEQLRKADLVDLGEPGKAILSAREDRDAAVRNIEHEKSLHAATQQKLDDEIVAHKTTKDDLATERSLHNKTKQSLSGTKTAHEQLKKKLAAK